MYRLAEGKTATCRVYDLQGKLAATFTVTMHNGQAVVETDSQKPYSVVVHI